MMSGSTEEAQAKGAESSTVERREAAKAATSVGVRVRLSKQILLSHRILCVTQEPMM